SYRLRRSWDTFRIISAAWSWARTGRWPSSATIWRQTDDLHRPFRMALGGMLMASLSFGLNGRELFLSTAAGLLWTLYNFAFIAVLSFGPALLVASGLNAAASSAVVSAASWVSIPAAPLGAWLAQRVGRPDTTIVTCLLLAALAIGTAANVGGG